MNAPAAAGATGATPGWQEPGRRARQMRLIPAADLKRLYEKSDLQGAWRSAAQVALLGLGAEAVQAGRGEWWLPAALVMQGIFVVSTFGAMHEAVHCSAFKARRPNEILAWLAGLAILFDSAYYKHFHLAHHRYTQDPARDPELLASPEPKTRADYWMRVVGLPYWRARALNLWMLPRGRFDGLDFIHPAARPEIVRSSRRTLGALAALLAGSLALGSDALFWCWILPLALGVPFLRLYLLTEHFGCSHDDDALRNTRTTLSLAPMRFLMWNLPFHAEHHLYPNVPFHRLAETHRLLAPHLAEVAPGYVAAHRGLYARFPR